MSKRAHFKKDTYWNIIRTDRGFKQSELAELMGTNEATISKWFTGRTMPTAEQIAKLCDFFSVPVDRGTAEFKKTHEEWTARKRAYREAYAPGRPRTTATKAEPTTDNVFALAYGKLSYEEFNEFSALCSGKEGDPLEMIYGKVDLETFTKIANIIKGV